MNKKYLANALQHRKTIAALPLRDKIFLAYGIVFLLMFGVVFGTTNFLIRVAFDRRIEAYVAELESEVSNNYTVLVDKVRKEVAAKAKAPGLHRAILKGQSDSRYLGETDLDIVEYGTAYGTLLASTWRADPRIGTNVMRNRAQRKGESLFPKTDTEKGNIRLRRVEQNGGIEPRLVVEVTQAGDWGFLTGGRLLSTWLETETAIRSDEHPIFLVQESLMEARTHATASPSEETWMPLNNASRHALALREEWARKMESSGSGGPERQERPRATHRKVDLQLAAAPTKRIWTGFLIEPLGSLFGGSGSPEPERHVELVVAYSHQRQIEWQQQLTIIMLLSGAGGLGFVYFISYVISRRMTRPIATLRAGVSELSSGNLDYRVAVRSKSEIGQLAEGFNQMARDLKRTLEERMTAERAAAWQDVAQRVAHEVKNPLFPIRLSVENLQQAKDSPEIFENIFHECTDTIIEEVDRIGRLIDEFQQFARMPKPKKEWVDLNEIVTSVLTLYRGGNTDASPTQNDSVETIFQSQRKNVYGDTRDVGIDDVDDGFCQQRQSNAWLHDEKCSHSKVNIEMELNPLPKLSLDPAQISQVLGNLFKNAMEAMPAGGTLRVQTHITPNGTGEETQHVALVVTDTGSGMSAETLENLFTPYYTTKTDGTGLGMAIIRRIVAEHGGEIDVKSDERIGTTVRIGFLRA